MKSLPQPLHLITTFTAYLLSVCKSSHLSVALGYQFQLRVNQVGKRPSRFAGHAPALLSTITDFRLLIDRGVLETPVHSHRIRQTRVRLMLSADPSCPTSLRKGHRVTPLTDRRSLGHYFE